MAAPIERANAGDLMQLALEGCPTRWHAGAVLTLGREVDPEALCEALTVRVAAVPRLRQLLRRTPPGCGRPIWIDDPGFDVRRHVRVTRCPTPGDDQALYDLAADVLVQPLPRDRPPWAATYVTGLGHGRSALVVVFHHVLADGLGGLAVLAGLVDGVPARPPRPARPPPRPWRLAVDAAVSRLRTILGLRTSRRRLAAGKAELGASRKLRAPPSSLNRPTGPRRRLRVLPVSLDAVRATARAHGGTVNDVALAAVTGALGEVLTRRGEAVDELVVSVIVTSRPAAHSDELGNAVGVIPVALPLTGGSAERLESIAATMHSRKQADRGASAAFVVPLFRAFAALRVLHWLLNRQRMINTIVTNVRGPEHVLTLLGAPITEIVPLTTSAGNQTVGFAVLSYAGVLAVTVSADPVTCPDLDILADQLRRQLAELCSPTGETEMPGGLPVTPWHAGG